MKKTIALLLLISLLVLPCGPALAAGSICVTVDNRVLEFDVPPVVESGRTLVPLRAIFEALGANVEYNPTTKLITARKGSVNILLTVNSYEANVDGYIVRLDVPARVVNGRTLVPLRFISESMDSSVQWDPTTRSIAISTAEPRKWKVSEPVWILDNGNTAATMASEILKEQGIQHSLLGGRLDYVIEGLNSYKSSIEQANTIILHNPDAVPFRNLERWPDEFTYLLPLKPEILYAESYRLPFAYFKQLPGQRVRGIVVVNSFRQTQSVIEYILANEVPLNRVVRIP